MRSLNAQRGVTLIELVIVMVILAIVAGTSMIFMQRTFVGYDQARQRILVAEQGRVALSRAKRELRLSLPNSARLSTVGSSYYLEFAPVAAAGRYRAGSGSGTDPAPACAADSPALADNSLLTIGTADTCFKPLGAIDASKVALGDWLVVFNAGPGYSSADYYESGAATGGNKAKITAATGTKLDFESASLTWDSPGHRFYVAKSPITYVCNPTLGTLSRWTGYAPQAAQPNVGIASLAGASGSDMARGLVGCKISYAPASIANQFGLITIALDMGTPSGDHFILQTQAQIANMP